MKMKNKIIILTIIMLILATHTLYAKVAGTTMADFLKVGIAPFPLTNNNLPRFSYFCQLTTLFPLFLLFH
jgi:hypothetical protein